MRVWQTPPPLGNFAGAEPTAAVYGQIEDVLVTVVECIDDCIVRRDDGVTAADVIARSVVKGCAARNDNPLEKLTGGQVAAFMKGFEEGLVDKATEEILSNRASKLAWQRSMVEAA